MIKIKIRWLGNACLEVIRENNNYLIDPNYLVDPKKIPDFVLLSHEHDDHFDLEKFNEFPDEIDLFAPQTALEKFDVEGIPIDPEDEVNGIEVLECDCYGSEESFCFFDNGLLHTADTSNFPIIKEAKVVFSACFEDLYDEYVKSAKNIDPEVVIPYHYNPNEELNLAKGLKEVLEKEEIKSEILELGETLEFNP